MSFRRMRLALASIVLLGGCQKDINHHPARIAVTRLVSLSNSGQQGNAGSSSPAVTPDGRFLVFVSMATNLTNVPVTGLAKQVYRRDLSTGETVLISVNDSGIAGDQDSDSPGISADGIRVVFRSSASNFSTDSNGVSDIYVRDFNFDPPKTSLLSGADGTGPNDSSGCFSPCISASGDYVAFLCDATNLVNPPVSLGFNRAFRRAVVGGATDVVDVAPDGSPSGSGNMGGISMSFDGRYISFDTSADLGLTGVSGFISVYVRDMTLTSNAVELVSVSLDPTVVDGTASSVFPSISADGRVIAFHSTVPNLVPDDSNLTIQDVFIRDLRDPLNPRTILASRHSSGVGASDKSALPIISPDGFSVIFSSFAINLADADFNKSVDVFWHDLRTGRTIRVSVNTALEEALGTAGTGVALTGDGRYAFFSNQASNLVTNDFNGSEDIFVRGPLY